MATLAKLDAQLAAVNAEIKRQRERDRCRAWKAQNRDWVRSYKREYTRANPEPNRQRAREYREKLRETPEGRKQLKTQSEQWRLRNREYYNELTRARYVKEALSVKLGVPIKDIPQDMLEAVIELNKVTRKIKELSK